MQMLRSFILGIIFCAVVAAVGGYAVLYSGAIPANADAQPGSLEKFVAGIGLRAVLRNDAPRQPNPVPLTDANLIAGIRLYSTHCSVCHGTAAGNAAPPAIAKGEYPAPPQLASAGVEDDPQGWTFWKIKHGIRWTGMPSWRYELNDTQIWTLALFLKHMDKLPPGPQAAWQDIGHSSPAESAPTKSDTASPSPKGG